VERQDREGKTINMVLKRLEQLSGAQREIMEQLLQGKVVLVRDAGDAGRCLIDKGCVTPKQVSNEPGDVDYHYLDLTDAGRKLYAGAGTE